MASFEELCKKRSVLKRKLTGIENYINNKGVYEKTEEPINKKEEELDKIYEDYSEIKDKLEDFVTDENEKTVEEKNSEFESQFWKIKYTCDNCRDNLKNKRENSGIPDNQNNRPSENQNEFMNTLLLLLQGLQANPETRVGVKLPELKLPSFSGKIEEWRTFIETFESIIHQEKKYSNIDKFHYLSSCLSDDLRSDLLSRFKLSNDGYELALQYLKDKYSNKRAITNKHFSELFKAKVMEKENSKELRTLIDCFSANLDQAKAINPNANLFDLLIVFMVSTKLDDTTRKAWEMHIKNEEYPAWTDMRKFLEERCIVLERVNFDKQITEVKSCRQQANNVKPKPTSNYNQRPTTILVSQSSSASEVCYVCKRDHRITSCPDFRNLSVTDRVQKVKELNLCFNCLSVNHSKAECTSKGRCRECVKAGKNDEMHHTMIHYNKTKPSSQTDESNQRQNNRHENDHNEHNESKQQRNVNQNTSTSQKQNIVQTHCCFNSSNQKHVFLLTAIVEIRGASGEYIPCRAMLDTGSQSSFITQRMANILNLKRRGVWVTANGLNEKPTDVKQLVETNIRSMKTEFNEDIELLILSKITGNVPSNRVNMQNIAIPDNVELADPTFGVPKSVDILIGGDITMEAIQGGRIRLSSRIHLRESKFGWLVAGSTKENNREKSSYSIQCHISTEEQELNQLVKKFWEIENVETTRQLTKEEQHCEDIFVKTTERNSEGRFIVKLPTRENIDELTDNRQTALRRFFIMESKLSKNAEQYDMYKDFMKEYEELGHMRLVKNETTDNQTYYLPHHSVIKMSSTTTKLRVVFDASCKTSSGVSLNDVLCTGPVVQSELFDIWVRFRLFRYAMTSDCKMMYRQILVNSAQTELQRIFWRSSVNEPLKCYSLQTVTYGTSSASFLATRCLKQLADDNQQCYPEAAMTIRKSVYMDDFLFGSQSIDGAVKLQTEVINILKTAKFELRKWAANHPTILENIPEESRESIENETESIKALGFQWSPRTDKLRLNIYLRERGSTTTKAMVLSVLASLFDPLGMVAPVVLLGKLLIRKLCQLKLKWEDEIPKELMEFWSNYQRQLQLLQQLQFDRFVAVEEFVEAQIHGFSDASQKAFGACLYLRSINNKNEVKVKLLCSKSKIAPTDERTVPELELCGAKLLATLIHRVRNSLENINITKYVCWSDSTIVLAWLKNPTEKMKTFVANRVAIIQRETADCEWRHVSTTNNPADHLTRGLMPSEIGDNELWWNGPDYLRREEALWPVIHQETTEVLLSIEEDNIENDLEIMRTQVRPKKLIRIFAFIFRFIRNTKKNKSKSRSSSTRSSNIEPLSVGELDHAKIKVIQQVQKGFFDRNGQLKTFGKHSPINQLNPVIDDNGILRVGGRIQRATINYDSRHPILLPGNHPFTECVIREIHIDNLHSGQRATLSFLRQEYWPLRAKVNIKRIIRKCVQCCRAKPTSIQQYMGDLPSSRVTLKYPFFRTGVDYCGPFSVKSGLVRSKKIIKAYVAVFVCMATKAVHLELVSDMSTDAFLAALDRFYSDHGIAQHMYSDNGTNFVGAAAQIKKLQSDIEATNGIDHMIINNDMSEVQSTINSPEFQRKIIERDSQHNINWHFIPPHAPEFGGLWESAVKSAKFHLVRVVGNALLTFEEMSTVLKKIAAILNSRPLFSESDDVNDLRAITPGHFLIGRAFNCKPDINVSDINVNRLNRWQRVQQLIQHFNKVWATEYLHNLQQRTKRYKRKVEVNVGDLVVMVDDNKHPMKWPLARIIEVHPGEDGIIRVVTIKTQQGTFKRPVSKVAFLPIENSEAFQQVQDVA